MIGGASPDLHDDADEGGGEGEGSAAGVEDEIGKDLREEAEGTFDVGLVLGPRRRGAHTEGVAEGEVDLGGVVGGTVVEQQRERGLAGGDDAVLERLNDGGGVLLAAHAGAGEGARVRVDIKLEVEVEALSVDQDGHLHAVADPLGAREEGAERATQCAFVGGPALASSRAAQAVDMEDARDRFTPERHEQAIAHVVTEADEGAVPARPRVEHGLHLHVIGVGGWRGRRLGRLCGRNRIAQPIFERAQRHVDGGGERLDVERGVLGAQLDDEAPEAVGVVLAHQAALHAPGVVRDVAEHRSGQRCALVGRHGRRLGRTTSRPDQGRQQRDEHVVRFVGGTARDVRGCEDLDDGRRR